MLTHKHYNHKFGAPEPTKLQTTKTEYSESWHWAQGWKYIPFSLSESIFSVFKGGVFKGPCSTRSPLAVEDSEPLVCFWEKWAAGEGALHRGRDGLIPRSLCAPSTAGHSPKFKQNGSERVGFREALV